MRLRLKIVYLFRSTFLRLKNGTKWVLRQWGFILLTSTSSIRNTFCKIHFREFRHAELDDL